MSDDCEFLFSLLSYFKRKQIPFIIRNDKRVKDSHVKRTNSDVKRIIPFFLSTVVVQLPATMESFQEHILILLLLLSLIYDVVDVVCLMTRHLNEKRRTCGRDASQFRSKTSKTQQSSLSAQWTKKRLIRILPL